jgi:DNA-binding MarR family transcriptional regulator
MTQLIARLQGEGLVTRVPDPADGRVVQVAITDQGRAVLSRRRAARTERLAALLATLSPEERAAMTAALPALDVLVGVGRDDLPVPAPQFS